MTHLDKFCDLVDPLLLLPQVKKKNTEDFKQEINALHDIFKEAKSKAHYAREILDSFLVLDLSRYE